MRQIATAVLIAVGGLLAAAPAHAVDPYEIQVYDGTANSPGAAGLELHLNHVASGHRASAPPELPLHGQSHATLEPSYGLFSWWELGGYFQTTLREDGHFDYAGVKLRSKFVAPPRADGRLRLGVNFELARVPQAYDADRWGSEVRPIVAWDDGAWLFAANPIFGLPLAGDGLRQGPTFEPALKVSRAFGHAALGAEYYAGLGPVKSLSPLREQEHYLYAAFDLLDADPFELNVGVGAGLNQASEGVIVKVILGWAFETGAKDPKTALAARRLVRR